MSFKYREAKNGESSFVPFEGTQYIACCDCGLVHRHVFSVDLKNGKIKQRVWRDNEKTATMRGRKATRHEIVRESKSNAFVILVPINHRRRLKSIRKRGYEVY